jgi:hypothetical protein
LFYTLITLAGVAGLSGCASLADDDKPVVNDPANRVIVGSYDEVWRAMQKAFSNYPIQVNNLDQGILETDIIKGAQIWNPPFIKNPKLTNYRYTINVRVIKGKTQGQESVRLIVTKKINLQRDFFSNDEELQSDGFEELSLLYRVERELQIERSLRKAFEKGKT